MVERLDQCGDLAVLNAALDSADGAWKQSRVDVSMMEKLLEDHLAAQLTDVRIQATSGHRDDSD